MTQPAPLYVFYGDDFTGSTDALEALASNGVRCVLFLAPPSPVQLQEFADCRAFGIAGESRSQTPQWMSEHLPEIFRFLMRTGAAVCHYKVCSTFDSAPERGSIGRALEIGRDVFGTAFVPIVAAAPKMQRYVLFGNLFAAFDRSIYRIDRHPAMSAHPATPMRDGDLRDHLARQSACTMGLIDWRAIETENVEQELDRQLATGAQVIFFDGWDEPSLLRASAAIWRRSEKKPLFAVGSSGLTYGLVAHWQQQGLLKPEPVEHRFREREAVLVVSGSCSPATERQIRWALARGFQGTAVDLNKLRIAAGPLEAFESEVESASVALQRKQSVVLYTALGASTRNTQLHGDEIGARLGLLLREIVRRGGVKRVIIAGGDTASHAMRQLDLYALTFLSSIEPGAPLCQGHSAEAAMHGIELVLKGGQVGSEEFFERVRQGADGQSSTGC